MKGLYFYLFYDDEYQEIISVSIDKISRASLQKSTINLVRKKAFSQAGTSNNVDAERRNSQVTDCGDCPFPEDGKVTDSKLAKQCKITKSFKNRNLIPLDRYQLSYFVYLLERSFCYRQLVIGNFCDSPDLKENFGLVKFKIKLSISIPSYHVMDRMWCERLERLCYERQELETAMAWLSTLGGAFSALGDKEEHCAVIAGKISVQQLKNALRLGDPFTVVRCKLYFSLSLIQRRMFKPAQHIIKEQYRIAIANAEKDFKLVRMCLGIWSKLKYEKKYKRRGKVS